MHDNFSFLHADALRRFVKVRSNYERLPEPNIATLMGYPL